MKKLYSMVLAAAITFCFTVNASAVEAPQTKSVWTERDNAVISIVQNAPTDKVDQAIKQYSTRITSNPKLLEIYKKTFDPAQSVKATIYKSVNISKNVQVEFYTNGTYAISVLRSSKSALLNNKAVLANDYNKVDYTYTRTWYGGIFNNKLYDITCYGDYFYDGTSAWDVGDSNSYYTLGDFAMTNVHDWASGVTEDGGSCTVYGHGIFGGHFEAFGQSFDFAQEYREVDLIGSPDGSIVARYTLN